MDIASSAPASFVPRPLGGANELIDNTVRETYNPNPVKEAGNRVIAKIPGAAQSLPKRKNVWGKDYERYQDGSNNLFNVLINPAFVSTLKADPASKEIIGIFRATGEQSQAPHVVGKKVKITVDGKPQNVELTGQQISDYQAYLGTRTKMIFDYLVKQPMYKQLPSETRAKIMAGVISSANQAAKYEILGDRPTSKIDIMTLGIITKRPELIKGMLNMKQAQGYVNNAYSPVKSKVNARYNEAVIEKLKSKAN